MIYLIIPEEEKGGGGKTVLQKLSKLVESVQFRQGHYTIKVGGKSVPFNQVVWNKVCCRWVTNAYSMHQASKKVKSVKYHSMKRGFDCTRRTAV